MLNRIAFYITEELISNGTVKAEDRDIYRYGFEMGFAQVINLISTLLIGFVFGLPVESMFFLISFMTLRTYAGGYHSSSHLKCYLLSITANLVVFGTVRLLICTGTEHLCFYLGAIGVLLLVWLAPVEDRNKPMDGMERIVFRKRAMRNLFIWSLITAVLFLTPWRNSSITLCLCLFVMGITVVCGLLKNKFLVAD